MQSIRLLVAVALLCGMSFNPAGADPCGMVPPITISDPSPITRVGDQQTYVFFKDGVEAFVIRPGFTGKTDEFGMLIPFPTPPEIRKVPDDIFPQITKAIDPPEVVVNLFPRFGGRGFALANGRPQARTKSRKLGFKRKDAVRVLKEEAVGMYEVAVLEAGSSAALRKWMKEHGYKYPAGMDAVCDEYVEDGWCFVAVKTKVAQKQGVNPRPGMREVNPKLPAGSVFDGHVQAMGFRFKTDHLVVPMRLSAFNEGELHNIVYLMTDGPRKIRSIPEEYVVRQISGAELFRNVTGPLPLRIIGGTEKDIPQSQRQSLKQQRNPAPHNGQARDLFAADVLAVSSGRLSHPHEEAEKMLLRIGEHFALRGPAIDRENLAALAKDREKAVGQSVKDLKHMTLTVIDGDFPREVLAGKNLAFAEYRMPKRRNTPQLYDAKSKKPAAQQGGVLKLGWLDPLPRQQPQGVFSMTPTLIGMFALGFFALGFVMIGGRLRRVSRSAVVVLAVLGLGILASDPAAAQDKVSKKVSEKEILALIDQLEDPKKANDVVKALVKIGQASVPHLLGEAIEGKSIIKRGWCIVCLSDIGGEEVVKRLTELYKDKSQPKLIQTWAAAAVVYQAKSTKELLAMAPLISQFPALGRPIGMRLVEGLSKTGAATAEDVINVTIQVPQLQQHLAPAIMAFGADKLVVVMTGGKNNSVANRAAAYLGTMAKKDLDAVAKAVIKAYKFDAKAKNVPWTASALWLPNIPWGKEHGRELVGNLIRWYLWCDLNNQKIKQRQIQANIGGVGLAGQVGYQRTSGAVENWLLNWGRLVGKKEIIAMLAEQDVDDKPRFKKILAQLK